jgi:transcription antitermination factor NusG
VLTTPSDASNDRAASLDSVALSCCCNGDRRWYCAWTHPNREHQAARELRTIGFEVYLPLHLARRAAGQTIVPMFPRYLFVVMVPETPWAEALRQFRNTGGAVAGLIRHAPDKPTPLPVGVIEDFIARTSWRGVVDDPPEEEPFTIDVEAPVSVADGPLAQTAGIVKLSSAARCKVLMGMFNREIVASVETKNLVAA